MQDQSPESNPASPVVLEGKTQVLGLDFKTAGFLCYLPICLVNVITSLIIVNSEPKDNHFLRFHATQSLVLAVIFMVASIANTILTFIIAAIPFIGMLAFLFNLAGLVLFGAYIWLSVLGIIAASKGEMKLLPYVGQIAEQRLAQMK